MVHKIYTKWMGSWLLACSWRRLNLDVWYGFLPPARRGYGFPVGRLYVGWLPSCRSSGVGNGGKRKGSPKLHEISQVRGRREHAFLQEAGWLKDLFEGFTHL